MKISELRMKTGMTQEEFAAAVGCSLSTVAKWEGKGKDTNSPGIGRATKRNLKNLEKVVKK